VVFSLAKFVRRSRQAAVQRIEIDMLVCARIQRDGGGLCTINTTIITPAAVLKAGLCLPSSQAAPVAAQPASRQAAGKNSKK
jgi:hypothetical protein